MCSQVFAREGVCIRACCFCCSALALHRQLLLWPSCLVFLQHSLFPCARSSFLLSIRAEKGATVEREGQEERGNQVELEHRRQRSWCCEKECMKIEEWARENKRITGGSWSKRCWIQKRAREDCIGCVSWHWGESAVLLGAALLKGVSTNSSFELSQRLRSVKYKRYHNFCII